MQGYGAHHHQSYDDHRYPSSSQYFSPSGADSYLAERRLTDQYLRTSANNIPRLSGTSSSYAAPSFEYGTGRSMGEFDPRPVHAGWTPKEEIDEEMQQRELLGGNGMGGRTPPGGADIGIHPGDVRDLFYPKFSVNSTSPSFPLAPTHSPRV